MCTMHLLHSFEPRFKTIKLSGRIPLRIAVTPTILSFSILPMNHVLELQICARDEHISYSLKTSLFSLILKLSS